MFVQRYLFLAVEALEGDDCVALVFVDYLGDFPLMFGVSDIDIVSDHKLFVVIFFDEVLVHGFVIIYSDFLKIKVQIKPLEQFYLPS